MPRPRTFLREIAYRCAVGLHPYLDGRMYGVSRRDHGELADMRLVFWMYRNLIGFYRHA